MGGARALPPSGGGGGVGPPPRGAVTCPGPGELRWPLAACRQEPPRPPSAGGKPTTGPPGRRSRRESGASAAGGRQGGGDTRSGTRKSRGPSAVPAAEGARARRGELRTVRPALCKLVFQQAQPAPAALRPSPRAELPRGRRRRARAAGCASRGSEAGPGGSQSTRWGDRTATAPAGEARAEGWWSEAPVTAGRKTGEHGDQGGGPWPRPAVALLPGASSPSSQGRPGGRGLPGCQLPPV